MKTQEGIFKEGIEIFLTNRDEKEQQKDYAKSSFEQLYTHEEKHFWFIARKHFIYKQLNKYLKKDARIIDCGAGTGNITRYLKHNGYSNICVGDMHLNALKYAKSYGIKECFCFDLFNPPFKDEFNCVLLFDVLEHINEDVKILINIKSMLRDNGLVALTVPAHEFLWNMHDVNVGHKRRYSKAVLRDALKGAGFEVLYISYFFSAILPLLYLRALLHKAPKYGTLEYEQIISQDVGDKISSMPEPLNFILKHICLLENNIGLSLPFGGSLLAIARVI